MSQVQQCNYPYSGHHRLHLCYCWGVASDGNSQCFSTCFATSLGGVPKQVLWRRWLQVLSILICMDWWWRWIESLNRILGTAGQKQCSRVCIIMGYVDSFIWTWQGELHLDRDFVEVFFMVSSNQSGCCLFVTGRNKQFIVRPEAWYVIVVAGMCNNKNI